MALFPYGTPKTEKKATSDLFVDWEKTKDSLVRGLSADRARAMNIVLENTRASLKQSTGQPDTAVNLQNMRNIVIPMIRRIMPGVIANDIMGVQPMTGNIFTMSPNYGSPISIRMKTEKVWLHWNCTFIANNLSMEVLGNIEDWLKENIPKGNFWTRLNNREHTLSINFYDEGDVVAFMLKWDNTTWS